MGINSDFAKFQSMFSVDNAPISNYIQYNLNNRVLYKNWCDVFCAPALYKKIKVEKINLANNDTPTDFSHIDKYVLAFGKSITTFTDSHEAYLDYVVHFPIDYGTYTPIGNQYKTEIKINAPYDDRFEYSQGDLLIFKINDYIFKFQVSKEPQSMSGILFLLELSYVDKCCVRDLEQTSQIQQPPIKREYW